MSTVDSTPLSGGDFKMPYGSQEQSSHGYSNPSTCREELPHGYPAGYSLSTDPSTFGFSDFSVADQDGGGDLPQAFPSEQTASYSDPRFASQFSQYGPQSSLYPPEANIGISSPGSSTLSGGISPHTFTEGFSPQNNPATLNYAQLQQFNNQAFDESVLGSQFGSMLSLSNSQNFSLGAQTQLNRSLDVPRGATSYPPPNMPTRSNEAQYGRSMATNPASPLGGLMNSINTQFSGSPQQLSPALSGSPSGISSSGGPSHHSRMVSPTVRIELCSRDDSPRRSRLDRSLSRSHGSRRSHTHLSPYPDDSSSEDEPEASKARQSLRPPIETHMGSQQRNEDGSWKANPNSGLTGLSPDDRSGFGDHPMPTLDEIQAQRHLQEKNADVREWLSRSEVGSEAGDFEPAATGSRRRKSSRPRAKSANDAAGTTLGLGLQAPSLQTQSIPGPGVYINEPSELDEDDDVEELSEPESPVADIRAVDRQEYLIKEDTASSIYSRPWVDAEVPTTTEPTDARDQPLTANAAIMRFTQRAQEIDSASLAATVGSRRRSESDLGSIVHAAGVSKQIQGSHDPQRGRRGTLLNSIRDNILPHRGNSNKMKRKGSQVDEEPKQEGKLSRSSTDNQSLTAPKRVGSFGRPKSPRLDTNVSSSGHASRSPAAVASGMVAHAKDIIRRSRSRSDLGKSPKSPGLADLWTQHGGPPVPSLASPATTNAAKTPGNPGADDDSGDEDVEGPDGVIMDLSVRTDMIVIPTYDGFKFQVQELNPRLNHYLSERLTQEQLKRYKRLVEAKVKHSQNVAAHGCSSKTFCFALGGESKALPPRVGAKDPEATLVGFQIMLPGMTEEELERTTDGQVVAAQFPSGVPLPPVKRLPAEFECPLCFKVKRFYKPSDWTKHVHEDVQPFTCTFANCAEPKSFKRKADWVRHENERHRQLECWTCDIGECSHTCYRKDNFVQHLVREHKVPEPKVRTGRSGGPRSPLTPREPLQVWPGLSLSGGEPTEEDVWALVERCRRDASKHPRDEPCKFCGNICNTWKKLTVHLAKHMEQISMPVLALIDQKRLFPDAVTYQPIPQQTQPMPILSTMAPEELPTGILCAEPAEMDTDMPELAINGVSSQMMQTYPPPSLNSFGLDSTDSSMLGPTPTQFAGQSYPPLMAPTRPRASSFNDGSTYSASGSRQGTTYPPAAIPSRNLSPANLSPQMDAQRTYLSPQNTFTSPAASGWSNNYLTPSEGTPEMFMSDGQNQNLSAPEGQMGMQQQGYSYPS